MPELSQLRLDTLQKWAHRTACLVFVSGSLVLIGWWFDLELLKSLRHDWAEMKPLGAVGFLLAAVSLAFAGTPLTWFRFAAGFACASLVGVIGLKALGEHLFGWRPWPLGWPGSIAPASGVNFFLVGLALALLHWRRATNVVEALILTAALASLVAVTGYLYGVKALYTIEPYASMAFHSALNFVVLCFGIALIQPSCGLQGRLTSLGVDGVLMRRLLPAIIVIPLFLGWVGLQGQLRTFYQTEFGTALLVVAMIISLVVLLWWSAGILARIDAVRQQIHTELSESVATNRALLENAAQAIVGSRDDGWIVIVNATAERLFGYSRDELRQRPLEILLPEKEGTYPWGGAAAAGSLETMARRKDGSRFPVEISLSHAQTVQGRLTVAFIYDISERRGAMEALRKSETRLARAQSIASLGTWEVQLASPGGNGEEQYWWSAEVYRIFGQDPNIMPTRERFLASVHPEDRAEVERAMCQTRQSGKTYQVEHRILRPDGAIRFVREHAECILDAQGHPAQLVGTVQDITEYRLLEQQFLQAQKLESLGRLAGGVAHDFNNLITVINGYSELALLKISGTDPVHENLEEIHKAGDRAAALTQQLLAFSRKQVLEPTVVNLNAVVLDAEKMLRRLIGEDIVLTLRLSASLCTVFADTGQIHQVIVNLAVNSRDAMPSGGSIFIETETVELEGEYADKRPEMKPGPYVMLAVSDTGIGMDEEVKSHIFDPFFTTKPHGIGTGLGLATVYGIVKQSGGWIWVDTEPGNGTTFKIYLPRVENLPAPLAPLATEGRSLIGRETILLVEDQSEVRKLAATMLRAYGYRVVEAVTAQDAVLIAEHNNEIDLVLSDVVMPDMSGPELVEQIRRTRPEIGVVFMSGYTEDALLHRGVVSADVVYVVKPFTAAGLAAKVRAGLAKAPS